MNVQKKLIFRYIKLKIYSLSLISKRRAAQYAFKIFCTPIKNGQPKETPIFKNAEKLELLLDNIKIRGFRFNHPQAKKILVLHGFSSYSYKFDNYINALVQKNYEVIAFDAPAHGQSDGTTLNAIEYKNMVHKIIEEYGPIQYFIAHSFGGLALCLAMEQMQVSSNIKIVLIAPATETTTAINSILKMLHLKIEKLKTAIYNHIFTVSGHHPHWFSIRRAIKNIPANFLWVHDEEDEITPLSDALKIKNDKVSHVQFLITKGLGHSKIYKDEVVKNAVINFLES